jgi:hypothetical protein
VLNECEACNHLSHAGRCPGYANCGCENDPQDAAVERYKARSALLFDILTTGTPDPDEAQRVASAHRIVGNAMEAEVFDPEPPEAPENSA